MDLELEALARAIAERVNGARPEPPRLRVVRQRLPEGPCLAPPVRSSYIRLIRSLERAYSAYGIDLIINQALVGKSRLEDLDDRELAVLVDDLQRARECIAEGISFEDAGLIRGRLFDVVS